jgi:hypothetical protein
MARLATSVESTAQAGGDAEPAAFADPLPEVGTFSSSFELALEGRKPSGIREEGLVIMSTQRVREATWKRPKTTAMRGSLPDLSDVTIHPCPVPP